MRSWITLKSSSRMRTMMGKYKNTAHGCWEMWQANRSNPDWEAIGKVHGVDASMAEDLARGWDVIEVGSDNDEPTWIG